MLFLPMLSGARESLARAAPKSWDCIGVNEYRTLHVLEERPSYWNLESVIPSGLVSDISPHGYSLYMHSRSCLGR